MIKDKIVGFIKSIPGRIKNRIIGFKNFLIEVILGIFSDIKLFGRTLIHGTINTPELVKTDISETKTSFKSWNSPPSIFGNIWKGISFVLLVVFSPFRSIINTAGELLEETYPNGRKNNAFQNRFFVYFILFTFILILQQPAPNPGIRKFFLYDTIILICYFTIMAIGLNLQTGLTGIVNFGVIFFVGFGALVTALVSTKLGLPAWVALIVAMALTALVGFLLAFPSLKLRDDYFAIVTVALGEVLRQLMLSEPILQTENQFGIPIPELPNVFGPLYEYWRANRPLNESYFFFLAFISIIFVILIMYISNVILNSGFGRVLKGIREDEDVVDAYGYNVFMYKAGVLAIGGAFFGLAGSMLAWKFASVYPELLLVTTTFFVWAAYIVGGKGNNKGMMIGATIIAFSQRIVRNLGSVDRDETIWLSTLDKFFKWIVVDLGGAIFGDSSWDFVTEFNAKESNVVVNLEIFQILVVGLIIIIFLRRYEDGLLPERPFLTDRDVKGGTREIEYDLER